MKPNTRMTVKARWRLNKYWLKYVEKNKCWALKGKRCLTFLVAGAPVLGGGLWHSSFFSACCQHLLLRTPCGRRQSLSPSLVFSFSGSRILLHSEGRVEVHASFSFYFLKNYSFSLAKRKESSGSQNWLVSNPQFIWESEEAGDVLGMEIRQDVFEESHWA